MSFSSPDPALEEYFETVPRNVRRARVRLTLGNTAAQWNGARGLGMLKGTLSTTPRTTNCRRVYRPTLRGPKIPTWNSPPNPITPSKGLAPSFPGGAPDRKTARCDPVSAPVGDQDFADRHAATTPTYLTTASDEQAKLAGREPNRGRPAFSVLCPEGNPTEVNHDPVCNQNFRKQDANDGWVQGTAVDPLAAALNAAHATLMDPEEFRALGENASSLRPLVGRVFQAWELPPRLARDGETRRNWRLGVRLGAAA